MRRALVTGAGSAEGIGFATARLLAARGAEVVITSTTERIHERAAELGVRGVVADLTSWDDAQRLIERGRAARRARQQRGDGADRASPRPTACSPS